MAGKGMLRLMTLDSDTMTMIVAAELQSSEYGALHGRPVRLAGVHRTKRHSSMWFDQRMVASMISAISASDAAITSATIGSIISVNAPEFIRAMKTLSSDV